MEILLYCIVLLLFHYYYFHGKWASHLSLLLLSGEPPWKHWGKNNANLNFL